MPAEKSEAQLSAEIAQQFCRDRGEGWSVGQQLGAGGTAPVFEVLTPQGPRALKIYDLAFSTGEKGEIEDRRIRQQLELRGHGCRSLVQIEDGGWFEGRLFLLMERAPGRELEKRLVDVPRGAIRSIVHQVAEAAIFLRSQDLCHRDIKSANVFVSDDFQRATLLDISVIRNVRDPIGAGTDHDGALPVLATARYSPPEYLFRLLEPTPDLWNALSVYQLGALLHDLIVRAPLFEREYEASKSNRYRFAWIVATVMPTLEAADVDKDLLLLAQRALDKRWERRSRLRLEDFLLEDPNVRRQQAIKALGLNREATDIAESPAAARERVLKAAGVVEDSVVQYFASNRVRVTHSVGGGATDAEKVIEFCWVVPEDDRTSHAFAIRLSLAFGAYGAAFQITCELRSETASGTKSRQLELPQIDDRPGVESTIASQAEAAFEELAMTLQRPSADGGV